MFYTSRPTSDQPTVLLSVVWLWQNLLKRKHEELQANIDRLENGLEKLKGTTSQVDDLKAKLAAQEQELAVKNDEANKLIQVVGAETDKVNATLQCNV